MATKKPEPKGKKDSKSKEGFAKMAMLANRPKGKKKKD
jgi:hypothetical protein